MVNRPVNWDEMTKDQRYAWLRDQRHQPRKGVGGPRKKLKDKDKDKVWNLIRTYNNQSLVATMLGVGRRTLIRFLQKNPIPETFEEKINVEEYEEIQTWLNRQKAFAKEYIIKGYLAYIQKFHNYQKENHPERVRPRLWTSDDILAWLQTFKPYQRHDALVAVRQLALKAPKQFAMIELSLLPTRRTHKARRSLAGKQEYYLTLGQVQAMKDAVPFHTPLEKARNKAIIAWLFNLAIRTGTHLSGKGLLGIKIENLHLDKHWARVQDKGDIWWHVKGLSDDTIRYTQEYLALRGNPSQGWLWVNGHDRPLASEQVNKMLKQAGKNAGIEGKKITCKVFRKSLVKHALEVLKMNPVSLIGTGKNPKTCFCVGWTDMKVLMSHYAPELEKTIEADREKLHI